MLQRPGPQCPLPLQGQTGRRGQQKRRNRKRKERHGQKWEKHTQARVGPGSCIFIKHPGGSNSGQGPPGIRDTGSKLLLVSTQAWNQAAKAEKLRKGTLGKKEVPNALQPLWMTALPVATSDIPILVPKEALPMTARAHQPSSPAQDSRPEQKAQVAGRRQRLCTGFST